MFRGNRAWTLLLAAGLAGALLSWWFATHTRPMNDEGAVLTAAAKILRGAVFYRDVDAYWAPGSAYLLAAALGVFGEQLHVARTLAAVSFVAMLLVLARLALDLLTPARALHFVALLLCLKVAAWPAWTAYFYWDLALTFACVSIALLVGGGADASRARLAAAGGFAALAFLCKQNVGLPLAAGACAVAFVGVAAPGPGTRVRRAASVATGFAAPLLLAFAGFAAQGLHGALLRSTFVRPLVGYLPTSGISFLAPLRWWELGSLGGRPTYGSMPWYLLLQKGALPGAALEPAYRLLGELLGRAVYASLVLAFAAAAWLALRGRRPRSAADRRTLALSVLALAVFASAFPRADWTHVMGVYPPVLLLLFALWERLVEGGGRRRLAQLERGVVLVAVLVAAAVAWAHQSRRDHRVELPRATLRVEADQAWLGTVVHHVDATLAPGEPLFVYGNEAYLYFLTGHFFDWPFSQLYPGQEGGDRGGELAGRLLAARPPLVLRGFTHGLGELDAIPRYAPRLDAAIRSAYVEDADFFVRNPSGTGLDPPREVFSVWRLDGR